MFSTELVTTILSTLAILFIFAVGVIVLGIIITFFIIASSAAQILIISPLFFMIATLIFIS